MVNCNPNCNPRRDPDYALRACHARYRSAVSSALRRAEIDVPCRDVGLPQEFQAHASRGEVLADVGLTDQNIARQVTGWVAALGSTVSEHEVSQHLD